MDILPYKEGQNNAPAKKVLILLNTIAFTSLMAMSQPSLGANGVSDGIKVNPNKDATTEAQYEYLKSWIGLGAKLSQVKRSIHSMQLQGYPYMSVTYINNENVGGERILIIKPKSSLMSDGEEIKMTYSVRGFLYTVKTRDRVYTSVYSSDNTASEHGFRRDFAQLPGHIKQILSLNANIPMAEIITNINNGQKK